MELLQFTVLLALCAVALGWIARRFDLPYPVALVVGGSVLGFIPGCRVAVRSGTGAGPGAAADPVPGGDLTSWRDFKASLRAIGMLAIGLVLVTTLAVGAALNLLVPDIPWAAAFAFGAIVSPPGRGGRDRHPLAPEHPAAPGHGARRREPGERCFRPGALQVRRRGGR